MISIDGKSDASAFGLNGELTRVCAMPERAQEYYILGRIAIKLTKSKHVVALGGGGIAGEEMAASLDEGVSWTVYAVSRGKKEAYASLMDKAAKTVNGLLAFFSMAAIPIGPTLSLGRRR